MDSSAIFLNGFPSTMVYEEKKLDSLHDLYIPWTKNLLCLCMFQFFASSSPVYVNLPRETPFRHIQQKNIKFQPPPAYIVWRRGGCGLFLRSSRLQQTPADSSRLQQTPADSSSLQQSPVDSSTIQQSPALTSRPGSQLSSQLSRFKTSGT